MRRAVHPQGYDLPGGSDRLARTGDILAAAPVAEVRSLVAVGDEAPCHRRTIGAGVTEDPAACQVARVGTGGEDKALLEAYGWEALSGPFLVDELQNPLLECRRGCVCED